MVSKTVLVLLVCCAALAAGNPAAGKEWTWKTRHPTVPVREGAKPPAQQPSERIVGGNEAAPHSYPHQVALYIDGIYFCGGSIISPEWVMTAAHCMDDATSVVVVAGAHNIQEAEASQVTMTSTDFTVHENYQPGIIHNDISVIRLPSPLSFDANIQAVSLPTSDPAVGTIVTPTGWGKTQDGGLGGISDVLMEVDVPIMDNAPCKDIFTIVTEDQICIDSSGGKGTCNGDSGGPLFLDGVTYGITSFGASAGCEAGYPDAFTRITHYLDWIEAHTAVTPP